MTVKHIVLVKFTEAANADLVEELSRSFAELPKMIEGITAFEAGSNTSPEGLNHGFTHAFVLTFSSTQARDDYLPHPSHQAFVLRLQPYLADVLVLDYELPPH